VQVGTGGGNFDGVALAAGDGVGLPSPGSHRLVADQDGTEVLLFDMAA
jgi:hypothetical protein